MSDSDDSEKFDKNEVMVLSWGDGRGGVWLSGDGLESGRNDDIVSCDLVIDCHLDSVTCCEKIVWGLEWIERLCWVWMTWSEITRTCSNLDWLLSFQFSRSQVIPFFLDFMTLKNKPLKYVIEFHFNCFFFIIYYYIIL